MLVLSRSPRDDGQSEIHILTPDGQRIVVTVCQIKGQSVRIGIAAPGSFRIYRGELLARTEREATRGT